MPPWRLVGRAGLIASVEARIAAGGSVVLTGSSGIGKTAVMDAVGAAAAARGEVVLRAAGAETERWIPYAGLADLLSQVPAHDLAGLPEPQRTAVGDVPPRQRQAGGARQDQVAYRLAWQSLLARCADRAPVLVLVDDAQWIDAASVDTITHAVRTLTGGGVRVLVAGRWPERVEAEAEQDGNGDLDGHGHPDGRGHGGGRVSPWLAAATAVEIAVPPLAPDELAGLLDQYGLPARLGNKLHADSGGNPYLALALGGAFTDRVPRHGRPVPLPHRVHVLISDRLGPLPEETRETLLVAALAVRPTVGMLLRAGRAEAEHDIRLAAAAGLLVTEGGGIRFTPPAVATVIAESACAAHRAEVHTALSAVVTDSAGRVRHRALASADPDAEVARSLVTAAEAARRQGSRRLAAELYLLAADRTPSEFDTERLEWLVAAAETGASAGLPEIVHRAADAVVTADSSRAQRVRVRMALIDLSCQDLADMDETFAAALNDADDDPALLAPLRLRLSWAALIDGQPGRSETEADLAAALALRVGDTATEAMALTVKATASRVTGRDDFMAPLDRALALPQPSLDGWLHMAPRFLAARFAVFDDRLDEAREDLLRMLALVERGSGEEVSEVLRSLSEVSARLGRCGDALDFAGRAIRIAEEAGLSPGPTWYNGAVAELAGGTVARATAYAERGIQASEQERDSIYLGRHLHVLGQARLRAGDVRGGVDALLRIRDLERMQGVDAPLVQRWHGDLASGLAALGRLDEAEELIGSTRRAIGGRDRGAAVTAGLDRAEAVVRAARGDADGALALLDEAARRFAAFHRPLEQGHCLLVRGGIERKRRRGAAARAAVAEALGLFTRCGARPWIEQAERDLARTGGGTGAGSGSGPGEDREPAGAFASLTAAEERIAVLVGGGSTNQEVAARMFLSVKTIEATLTRIYRKLGVRSRTQLSSVLRSTAGGPDVL